MSSLSAKSMVCLCTAYRSCMGTANLYRIKPLQKWRGKSCSTTGIIARVIPECGEQWSLAFPWMRDWNLKSSWHLLTDRCHWRVILSSPFLLTLYPNTSLFPWRLLNKWGWITVRCNAICCLKFQLMKQVNNTRQASY